MSHRFTSFAVALSLITLAASPVVAQAPDGADGESFVPVAGEDLEFSPLEIPGFDPGMEMAPVMGDPSVAGEPYTLRLSFPDGYRFPPHWHPMAENVTVIEGTFLVAMGEEADESELESYQPGDYTFIEAENPHFGGATGYTVIQLHGTGPFDVIVVGSPQDDR